MNAVQFTELLEKPTPISAAETTELAKLVDQFPYFQSAHLLYLKGLHQNKSIEYPKQLKVTAAYANDRKKLYELIMKQDLHEQIRLVEEYSDKKTPIGKVDVSPLEAQILQEAVSASIKLEVAQQPESTDLIQPKEKVEDENQPIIPEERVEKVEPRLSVELNQKRSFNEWLRAGTEQPTEPVETEATSDEEPSLIDKFIDTAPRIGDASNADAESGRQPFFSPVDTARLSLVDDPSFVTETLAGIYQAQGYLEKAKNAYTLLSLKYPQKKATFAARIEALELEINKKK